mmetsp:Transcript_40177/g.96294  ORF Transcript_40177/g.96294 Transcript_40177/m.96294 type:complete len:274 (-) Transcript_40177:71-892(-)
MRAASTLIGVTWALVSLRGNNLEADNDSNNKTSARPCSCEASNAAWQAPSTARAPRCVFIDLGAADGNTFNKFLGNGYTNVKTCPSGGAWEAYLVEANPRFAPNLQALQQKYPGKVHVFASTAAFMCAATASFYLDSHNHDHNYWGSSMSSNHPDAVRGGHKKVTVPTVNVIKMIRENTVQGDSVILKMDIEGAEWDIVPCLASSPFATLVDAFYLEEHPLAWNPDTPTTEADMKNAKAKLIARGVKMPQYFSQTLFVLNGTEAVGANASLGM